ncbi:hypothetical protein WJX84_006955 [Apatococcus fuscideae]|uniref:Kinesin motor domain-containing protein n=1 Tax=Apatococcus fuscideae TaxID=2026836 RepID=A0AAW1RXD7_9CHLO
MQGQAVSTSTVVADRSRKAKHCKIAVAIKPHTSDAAAALSQGRTSGATPCVEYTTKRSVTVPYRTGSKMLTFESVHQGTQDQMSMWQETGRSCFEDTVLGYHPCAIMYGQTGSGKSHSTAKFIDHTLGAVFEAASLPANDEYDQVITRQSIS